MPVVMCLRTHRERLLVANHGDDGTADNRVVLTRIVLAGIVRGLRGLVFLVVLLIILLVVLVRTAGSQGKNHNQNQYKSNNFPHVFSSVFASFGRPPRRAAPGKSSLILIVSIFITKQ